MWFPLVIECGFADSIDVEALLHHLVGFVKWFHFVKSFAGQVSRLENESLEFSRTSNRSCDLPVLFLSGDIIA